MLFGRKKKVLIVDDEEDIVSYLSFVIKSWGNIEVSECHSIGEAVSELRLKNFDLAIIDINMKSESGYDLIKILDESNSDTPAILISGAVNMYDDPDCSQQIYERILTYISKPFKLDELKSAMEEAFNSKSSRKAG